MTIGLEHVSANIQRFSGYAETYDAYRPQPPSLLPAVLIQIAQIQKPHMVVDLGSGTGLSTLIWADLADEVIGIEPNADMRLQAMKRTQKIPPTTKIHFEDAISSATNLPDSCADVVTCSQSFHWMEPQSTLAEVARILRHGGVFAAYNCDWPPTMHWEAEKAFIDLFNRVERIDNERKISREVKKWSKEQHLASINASGHFRFSREVLIHSIEKGNAERLAGLVISQGNVATLLKAGLTEEEVGVVELRAIADRTLGSKPIPWYFSYRVRLAIK